jgi:hypothetical protein
MTTRTTSLDPPPQPHQRAMVAAPDWDVAIASLSHPKPCRSPRRIRIEIELADHGGNDNSRLPVTKARPAVAPAIREAEALGFIKVEHHRGGNSDHRKPNLFRLTFAHDRDSHSAPPTHDWRRIKTPAEARIIGKAVRATKSEEGVSLRSESRSEKQKMGTETVPKPSSGEIKKLIKPVAWKRCEIINKAEQESLKKWSAP